MWTCCRCRAYRDCNRLSIGSEDKQGKCETRGMPEGVHRRKVVIVRGDEPNDGASTQVAGTPPLHNVGFKKSVVETLNNAGHPTRCPQPLNSVRLMVSYIVQCLHNYCFKPTLCKEEVPATCVESLLQTVALTRRLVSTTCFG